MKKKVHKDEERTSLLVVIDFDRTHFHTSHKFSLSYIPSTYML